MDENRYALLVGINDYTTNTPLNYSLNDVRRLEKTLTTYCNFEQLRVRPLTSDDEEHNDITFDLIKKEIDELASDFIPEQDVFLFYYSGHGSNDDVNYILDLDCQEVQLTQIFDEITKLSPKYLIFIIDSCHSGVAFEFKGAPEISFDDYLATRYKYSPYGFYLLASSSRKERSVAYATDEMGLYTKNFIKCVLDDTIYSYGVLPLEDVHSKIRVLLEKDKMQIPHMQIVGGGFHISDVDWHKSSDEEKSNDQKMVTTKDDPRNHYSYSKFETHCQNIHNFLCIYDSLVIGEIFNDYTDSGITISWFGKQEYAAKALADKVLEEGFVNWTRNIGMRELKISLDAVSSFQDTDSDSFWELFYENFPDIELDLGLVDVWKAIFNVDIAFE